MKRVVSFVLNNFTNDNRVHKTARSLAEAGYDVTVMALKRGDVKVREEMDGFKIRRIELMSDLLPDGKIFSVFRLAELVTKTFNNGDRFDICHCNDFEPMIVASLWKKQNPSLKIVYDTHEYAREKNGLNGLKKLFVRSVEPLLIKNADEVITVSEGIATEYRRLFGLEKVNVIYNAPHKEKTNRRDLLQKNLGIGREKKIFLYQGGLAKGRGVELLIKSFERLQETNAVLVFMGYGDLITKVQEAADRETNIYYHPVVPYDEIVAHTSSADFGLLSVENVCLSYYYCMPNKMFEYIHAQIPIITTNLHDCKNLIEEEKIGLVIPEFTVDKTVETIEEALKIDTAQFAPGLRAAKEKFHWAIEEKKLLGIYAHLESR